MATLAAPRISVSARNRPDVTDDDLVQAVRQGDDHAFERLYHRYHRRISAYIFGMVHDHGRAEDLTQEVFVSALRRMRQTDAPIAFKAWVYAIAKNACVDAFRRSQRAEEVSIDAPDGGGLAPGDHGKLTAGGPSPDAAVECKQQLDDLCGAFGGLSDTHHQILVMRELEGLSYREIGERLRMSRPSVESTLFRARRRLTEEYEELRTGERCLRVQEVIGRAAAGPLGTRDQRRVASHISQCRPCRRQAVMAGLDATVLPRRPVRTKIAALLPLPTLLRRHGFGREGGGVDAAAAHGTHHGPALAQVSMAAAQYGEPTTMAAWMKAGAVGVAVVIAGLGAGAAEHAATSGKRHDAPIAHRAAATAGAVAVPAAPHGVSRAVVRTSSAGAAHIATTGAAGHRQRASAGAGSFSDSGSGASRGGAPRTPSSSGSSGSGASGLGENDSSASPSGGGSSSGSSVSTNTTTAAGQATGAVTGAASGATGAVGTTTSGATGGGSTAPLVQPDLTQLTQASAGAATPPTAGDVVSGAANVVGNTVGGQVGDAVEQTGAAAGDTVDQVTQSVTDAAGGLLGGT